MANKKSRFPSYGLVRGPSHEHGGVAGVVADEQPVELEGGEWIIPKEVVPDYLPVLKQITNEGRAIQKMENGNTAMDALIASASLQTGLAQPKSPMYQEGGEVAPTWGERFVSRFPSRHQDPERAVEQQRALAGLIDFFAPQSAAEAGLMLAAGPIAGRVLKGAKTLPKLSRRAKEFIKKSKEGEHLEDFSRTEPGMAGPIDWSGTSPKTMSGRQKLEAAKEEYGRRKRLAAEMERYEAKYADEIAESLNPYDNPQVGEFMDDAIYNSGLDLTEALAARKAKFGYEQGGMIDKYQAGGQALPRKQQEMRNPTVYGPPIELMGPMPADTSAVDTTGNALQHMLNQLMMRDVNQNINPFTGDTIDTYLDSLRLQQRMKKSKIPQDAGRKKARQGGPVMYQQGGMVQDGQALERIYGQQALQQTGGESPGGYFPLASQTEPGALMESIRSDRRIMPLQRDKYIVNTTNNGQDIGLRRIPLAKPFNPSAIEFPVERKEIT